MRHLQKWKGVVDFFFTLSSIIPGLFLVQVDNVTFREHIVSKRYPHPGNRIACIIVR